MNPPNSDATPQQKPPRFALLIASGFGLGYLPKAPGTWGSLGAILLAWATWSSSIPSLFLHPEGIGFGLIHFELRSLVNLVVFLAISAAGVVASSRVAAHVGKEDPQQIVVDEVSGQLVPLVASSWVVGLTSDHISPETPRLLVLLSPSWQYLLAGFILFRIFDIWKPWPVRAAEKLPGGWGIMADDWVAGVYAAICLWGLRVLGL